MAIGIIARVRQGLAAWVIKACQRFGPRRVRVLGRTYGVTRQVFNPKLFGTSRFMARHMRIQPDDVVLDMGTGSGILAIVAGQTAAKVVAVDVTAEAVRCARDNVAAHGLEDTVAVVQGDLFAPLRPGQRFSVILFSPPYLEGTPRTPLGRALYDPDKALLGRFFREAGRYLTPGGCVQMVYSSIADPDRALAIARLLGWRPALLARTRAFGETLLLCQLDRKLGPETKSE